MPLNSIAAKLAALLLAASALIGYHAPATAQACKPGTCCTTTPTTGAPACGAAAGNPLNVMSGNKFQREVDMPALPGVLGLELVRYYNSEAALAGDRGILGRGWQLSYDAELVVSSRGNTITIHQSDGTQTRFFKSLVQMEPGTTVYNASQPGQLTLRAARLAGTNEYSVVLADGNSHVFDAQGKLARIVAPTGEFTMLQRDAAGILVRVTDPQGRTLSLRHLGGRELRAGKTFRGVQHIDSPVGRFSYTYGNGNSEPTPEVIANLTKVSLPTSYDADTPANPLGGSTDRGTTTSLVSRSYHYEDARHLGLLTGISVQGLGSDGKVMDQRLATWAYDARGRATLSVKGAYDPNKPGPEQVTLEFKPRALDGSGTTVLTNSLGQTTRYRYAQINGQAQLMEVRGAGCATCGTMNVQYRYDSHGRQSERIQLDTQGVALASTLTEYDGADRPIRISTVQWRNGKPGERQWQLRYQYGADSGNWRPTLIARPSVIAGKEHRVHIEYNDRGQALRVTESGFSPIDDQGKPTADGAPISRSTRYGYAAINGRSVLTSVDGPLPNGPKNSPEDSDVTRVEWDRRGDYTVAVMLPGGLNQRVHRRDEAGRTGELAVSDGVRVLTAYAAYDATSRPTEVSHSAALIDSATGKAASALWHAVRFLYDANGRLTRQLGSDGELLLGRYDAAGNMTQLLLRDGSQIARTYDSDSRRTATALYGPGAHGALLWNDQYLGREVAGQLFSTVPATSSLSKNNPSQERHEAAPDAGVGWLRHARSVDTVGRFSFSAQAEDGSVVRLTRPDGSVVTRRQDDFARTVVVTSPELGTQTASYDGADQLALVSDRRGVTRYWRDHLGRPHRVESVAAAPGTAIERTQYSYRGALLTSQSHYVDRREDSRIVWVLDAWGNAIGKRLVILPETKDGHEMSLATRRRLDAAGRVKDLELPSGSTVEYERDLMGRVVGIRVDGRDLITRRTYAVGRQGIVAAGQGYGNGLKRSVDFDPDGRVRAIHDGPQQKTFVRDDAGRLKQAETAPAALAAVKKDKGYAIASTLQSVAEYQYDTMGRLTSEVVDGKPSLAVQYSASGDPLGSALPPLDASRNVAQLGSRHLDYDARGQLSRIREQGGSLVAQYRYDSDGIRIGKRVGKQARYFFYDEGRLLAETNGAGQVTVEYIHADGVPVALLRNTTRGRQVEYLHTDHRGAVEAVTNAQGRTIWAARQSAFGTTAMLVGEKADMPLRLLGQYEDGESGLHYNVHRYYDSATGRFLQPDPKGVGPSINVYAYADSDPIGKTDPLGLEPEPDDSPGLINATLFGTIVHSQFARQVRALGPGWGGDDSRSRTWTGSRPDAYFVDRSNLGFELEGRSFSGELWELKPIGWRWDSAKYDRALGQLKGYITGANRGCWVSGSSSRLSGELRAGSQLPFGGTMWDIRYVQDNKNDHSGLIFYTRTEAPKKPQPVSVPTPAPSLSKSDYDELEAQMQQIKQVGGKEGWSALQIIGMIALVGLAIAALVALAVMLAPVVAGITSAIAVLLSLVSAGKVALMAGLAAVFGFSSVAIAADAQKKGEEKQAGVLDKTIDWFKSWF